MRIRTLPALLALLILCLQGTASAATATATAAATAKTVTTGLQFGEGAVFVGADLHFVDYAASTVYRLDGGRRAVPVWHRAGSGTNGLVVLADNSLLVACYDSGEIVQITPDGHTLRTIDRDSGGAPFDRPNDLARGNGSGNAGAAVYFTASGGDNGAPGKVYRIAPDGTSAPREVATSIRNANGIAVSPDGQLLYVGESTTDKVLLFDIAGDGSLRNRRDFLVLDTALAATPAPRHTPDGIRTDREGRLFVSLYNGRGFAVFDAGGGLLATVPLPGAHHTSLALSPDERQVFGTFSQDAAGPSGGLYQVANPLAK